MFSLAKYRVLFFFFIATIVFSGTFIVIKLASGYGFDFKNKVFTPRGLLAATSDPYGAELFVNAKLKGATDTTLFLTPGEYLVEIKKDNYTSWQKKLQIQKELVTKTEAFLFLKSSDLRPLTFNGSQNPKISPDGTKLVYSIPFSSLKKDALTAENEGGLWVMDLTDFIFNITRSPRQIVQSQPGLDFAGFSYSWTPDSRQILVEKTNLKTKVQFFLDVSQLNSASALVNISETLPETKTAWEKEEKEKLTAKMQKLPIEIINLLNSSAKDINFSPDNLMVLYTATASATIPPNLIPPVIAASTQKEERKISLGRFYVYDIKEDKNFQIPLTAKTPKWFFTSKHLFWIESAKDKQPASIVVCEYDGTNLTIIYSGPFIEPFAFAAPGGNKLIVLAKIENQADAPPNLYSISLK